MYFDLRLWGLTRGVRLRIAGAVAVGLLAAAAGVGRLALLGWLLALVFRGEPLDALTVPFAWVAGVMLLRGVLDYWRNMVAHRTAALVQLRLRERLYDKVVELGPAHFALERTGGVILSVIDGVEQLETYFGQYLPHVFVCMLTPLGIFAFVAILDLPVAAVLLAFALVTLLAPLCLKNLDRTSSRRRQLAYSDFAAEFLDSIQGLATLKAFGQSTARARLLAVKAHELFRSTMWVLATNQLQRGVTDTGIALGAAAALALGAWRVDAGTMSLEALLIILMMGIETFRPLRELRELLHTGMNGQSAAGAIFQLFDSRPLIRDSVAEAAAPALAPTVEFDGVEFAYPGGRRDALSGLGFRVAAGERIGFVGPSGAGKSTVVRLLLRLYDPQKGSVRLGGRDLRELSFDEIRGNLAVLNQDTYLFHGTVEDNLRLGKLDAAQDELEAAARAANAHDFVALLPQGYRTVIGERGVRLSGGQRQRIAIARALLRDAPILVLDEALSSVDSENEAVILEALDRLMKGRTTLIFAHRLSSVIDADRIVVIEEGRVAESGTHARLMGRHGAYHRLMAGQAEDSMAGEPLIDVDSRDRPEPATAADLPGYDGSAQMEPTDSILRAQGMGWFDVIRELMRLVMPWKAKLTGTFVLGIARVCALIGVGVVSALIVAAIKTGSPFHDLLVVLWIVAPMAGVLHWLESWLAHDFAFRLLSEMRIDLFNKLDRLAPAYLLRRRTGDLVAMVTHDTELVEFFFAHTIAPAAVAVLVPTAVLAILTAAGWPMAAALMPFLGLVALSPFLMRRRIDSLGSRAREALGELNAHAVDTIQGLAEIIAFQATQPRRREFVERIRDHHRVRLPFFRDLTIQTALVEAATGFGGLAIVVSGANLVAAGALEGAYLPLLTLLAMASFLPLSEISNIGRQLADTLGSTRRLYAVHNEPVAITDGPGVATESDSRGSRGRPPQLESGGHPPVAPRGATLELAGVDFAYPAADRLALADVGFTVPPGGTVALVGPSGAGKTTAANLLLRFWDPLRGSVRMNGRDLRDYDLDDLRRRIALVTQDTFLFNTTLRDNIMIARPEASAADLSRAIERSALTEFVDSLPEGLETPVGERGVQLSGGQRQRVAIARAILKDAPVLILDEATSHLDAVNEQAVHQALERLMTHRTTVVIAHRLSTIRNAHRIVVLDAGRVVETGTHGELLARGGLYAHLVSRQLAGAHLPAAE